MTLRQTCYFCDELVDAESSATVHYGLATMPAHLVCCRREVANGALVESNPRTLEFRIPRLIYS